MIRSIIDQRQYLCPFTSILFKCGPNQLLKVFKCHKEERVCFEKRMQNVKTMPQGRDDDYYFLDNVCAKGLPVLT